MNNPTPGYALTTLAISIGAAKTGRYSDPEPNEAMAILQMAIRREREALTKKLRMLEIKEQHAASKFMAYRRHVAKVYKLSRTV